MIEAIIARLKSNAPLLGNRVDAAAALAALIASDTLPQTYPCAWVIPVALQAGELASGTGVHRQKITRRIGILWAVGFAGSPAGSEITADVAAIEDEIIAALAGFVPVTGQGSMRLQGSVLSDAGPGLFFYQTDFSFDQQLRITS